MKKQSVEFGRSPRPPSVPAHFETGTHTQSKQRTRIHTYTYTYTTPQHPPPTTHPHPQVADVISLHLPLTPQTQGLINKETLGKMKPKAVLLNTSRGGLVDSKALIDALKAKKLVSTTRSSILSLSRPLSIYIYIFLSLSVSLSVSLSLPPPLSARGHFF
jgi:hypothetical protein